MSGKQPLRYFGSNVCRELRRSVGQNLERYLSAGFEQYANEPDWSIKMAMQADLAPLEALTATVKDDAKSSALIWSVLGHLPASLAMEKRLWTRLTHVECIDYSRARWIASRTGTDAVKAIEDHFFADTRTGCRDDNALGRLWWTAYVAYLALPSDHHEAIQAIWKSADIRSNVIERPWISSRPKLASAIVRALLYKPSVSATEAGFREFMKTLNRQGGGLPFEVMSDEDVDAFVDSCIP